MYREWTDIGDDHQAHAVSYGGDDFAGMNIRHKKPDGTACVHWVVMNGRAWVNAFKGKIQGWDVIQETPLTLAPSILCRNCGDHGFIENGRWKKA